MPNISKEQSEKIVSLVAEHGRLAALPIQQMLQGLLDHPAPFVPITADMVTDDMLAQVHKANTEAISGYSERLLFANVVNAYMKAKKK